MGKAQISFDADDQGGGRVRIRLMKANLIGKQATLSFDLNVHVHDSRAVHGRRTFYARPLTLSASETEVEIPPGSLHGLYSYSGSKIDLRPELRLVIDDGILFDSTIDQAQPMPIGDQPRVAECKGALMNPADAYSFFANLSAIPHRNRMITLALMIVGGVVVIANALIGVHDEFVTEAQTLFYDHSGSDGSESPIMKALMGSGAAGLAIWAAIKAQLRTYMRFALKSHVAPTRGMRLAARDLVDGVGRVALEDITLRVVACNRECGQYKRGSGTKERTVSFKEATRAVRLYERHIALVPANTPLAMYLDGDIDFEPMFKALYPPLEVGSSHGLTVAWEVQLLHPKFVDHELEGQVAGLRYDDFLDD